MIFPHPYLLYYMNTIEFDDFTSLNLFYMIHTVMILSDNYTCLGSERFDHSSKILFKN
jgi:hypothetical protein